MVLYPSIQENIKKYGRSMSRFRVFDGLPQIMPIKSMKDNNEFNNDSYTMRFIYPYTQR